MESGVGLETGRFTPTYTISIDSSTRGARCRSAYETEMDGRDTDVVRITALVLPVKTEHVIASLPPRRLISCCCGKGRVEQAVPQANAASTLP